VVALYERERSQSDANVRNADDDPSQLEVTVDGDQIEVTGQGSAIRRWRGLMLALGRARGYAKGPSGHAFPQATIQDVERVIDLWNEWIAQVPDALPSDSLGAMATRSAWAQTTAKVADAACVHAATDVYADNERFWWHDLKALAEYVDISIASAPTWYERVADTASIPISYAAGGARKAASGVFDGAKDVVDSAERALTAILSVLLKPLLIGATIFGAGLLLVVAFARPS
jgi:hypothetical protein